MIGKFLSSAHRNKKRKLCKQTSGTKLYQDDHKELVKICERNQQTEGEVLREIVSDWLRGKRVETLGRNQVEDPIRRIYERVIGEQIAPLVENIKTLKSAVESFSKGEVNKPQTTSRPSFSGDEIVRILGSIDELRSLLEQTGSELSETGAAQMNQLDQLHQSQLALQTIGSETFASSWTIADLFIRYLVEVDLRTQEMEPDRVEQIVAGERRGLRLEGLNKIAEIESFFQLPEKYRLAQQVLTSRTFPLSIWSSSSVF